EERVEGDFPPPHPKYQRRLRGTDLPVFEAALPDALRGALAARFSAALRSRAVVPFKASGLVDAAFLPRRAEPGWGSTTAFCKALKVVPLTSRNSMRRASRSTRATCTCTGSVRR